MDSGKIAKWSVATSGVGGSTPEDVSVAGVDRPSIGEVNYYVVTDVACSGSLSAVVGYHVIEPLARVVTVDCSCVVPLESEA